MTRFVSAAAALALCAACSTAATSSAPDVAAATATAIPTSAQFQLAMGTAASLVEAGNTQTAIDRLTQLIGDPDLSDEETAAALLERGKLRQSGAGYDVFGAIADFEEVGRSYPDAAAAGEASALLDTARGQATSMNFKLEQPDTVRADRFSLLFGLGEHEEAIDLMLAGGVTPSNDELVAMYQIGYLCEGAEYTGPSYSATEPDGTPRNLRFCDFGK